MLLLSPILTAGEWRVLPRLNLSETYTDNVRLGGVAGGVGAFGAGGNAGGDFVTQINPGVVIRGQAPRYNLER